MIDVERAERHEAAAKAMQNGVWPGLLALPEEWDCGDMGRAWEGSIDGAHAIYEAHFFPKWIVYEMDHYSKKHGWNVCLASKSGTYVNSAREWGKRDPQKSPARAWLIALLFAKAEELRGEPNSVRAMKTAEEAHASLMKAFGQT